MTGNSKSGRRQNVIVIEPREIDDAPTEQSNWPDESFNSVLTESSRLRPMENCTVLETSEEVSKVTNREVVDTSAASQQVICQKQMPSHDASQLSVSEGETNTSCSVSKFKFTGMCPSGSQR